MKCCDQVKCFECEGTGSTVPDCRLCNGQRSVRLKRAYALGWKKSDLPDGGDGTYCECPECYDDAGPCAFCYGDGYTEPFIESQQRARILIMAKYNEKMPVCFRRDRLGRLTVDKNINLLSMSVALKMRDEGLVEFFGSNFFGHSLAMNAVAKQAAMEAEFLYRDLCRQFVRDKQKLKLEHELYKEIARRPMYPEYAD
jgi:hypothetical protein